MSLWGLYMKAHACVRIHTCPHICKHISICMCTTHTHTTHTYRHTKRKRPTRKVHLVLDSAVVGDLIV